MCIFAPEENIANERSGSCEPLPGVNVCYVVSYFSSLKSFAVR